MMITIQHIRHFFSKPFFSDYRTLLGLWLLLPVIAALLKIHKHNNFLIFRGVFQHTWEGISLYSPYPDEYFDVNHYGPLFSMIIAPFALPFVPVWIGLLFWLVALSLSLFWATRYLPMPDRKKIFIYWFCAHELLTALFMSQFNIAIAAIIIGTFYCIEKGKDGYAALLIVIGTFVKLYGIVGLAFFFFSHNKTKFIFALIGWSILGFIFPMLISSPEYIVEQYKEWYVNLVEKNDMNMFSQGQNVSFLGMVRKISGCASYSDLWLIVPGLILFFLPYLRIGQYRHLAFRYALLSSVLLFVVLFSTGSESSTYIIPFMGVAIWYVTSPWQRNRWDAALMIFAFILTSMSPSDLFPAFLRREYVHPYALKALPCMIIWLRLSYEMLTKDYSDNTNIKINNQ